MKPSLNCFLTIMCFVVAGCSTPPLFPPDTTSDVASSKFGVLQAKTDVFKGRVVQLAGRIVGIEESASGTIIFARELPVEKHPVFGPTETNEPASSSSFAVLYPGRVDRNALWFGNKFIVVAVAQGQETFSIDGIPRTEPYVIARCMHVWKTGAYGSYGIEDFPYTPDGYYPLEHQTYCAS
jgi:starvation-inducible outer membrane lipoprotein